MHKTADVNLANQEWKALRRNLWTNLFTTTRTNRFKKKEIIWI